VRGRLLLAPAGVFVAGVKGLGVFGLFSPLPAPVFGAEVNGLGVFGLFEATLGFAPAFGAEVKGLGVFGLFEATLGFEPSEHKGAVAAGLNMGVD
jgi:hypothetical protein